MPKSTKPAKKSLFERLGMVERVDDYPAPALYDCPEDGYETPECDPSVNTDGINMEGDFVKEVYQANDLADESRSIFKIEEITQNLPTTMPTDVKLNAVVGILASFGLTPDALVNDGTSRLNALDSCATAKAKEENDAIFVLEAEIENLKVEIATREQLIAEAHARINSMAAANQAEGERITNLIRFITPKITSKD